MAILDYQVSVSLKTKYIMKSVSEKRFLKNLAWSNGLVVLTRTKFKSENKVFMDFFGIFTL